jgi:starch-binding outer membrane protein, SusD/RagB family
MTMKLFKCHIYVTAFLMILVFISCKKQLEEVAPPGSINKSMVYNDTAAALTLYTGVYNAFRSYHYQLLELGEVRSEIWAGGLTRETPNADFLSLSTQDFNSTTIPIKNWGNFYSLIDKINTVIQILPQTKLYEKNRNKMMGEMYGLRAYVYYTLLMSWGGVPLTLTPVTKVSSLDELYRGRATENEVMNQIKNDLDKSIELFNNDATFSSKRIYWNLAASLVLKGDVYIWSGTNLGGGATDFTIARQVLEQVKSLPGLALQSNYSDIFNPTKKVNNSEIIFSINFEKNQATQAAFNDFRINSTTSSTTYFDATGSTKVSTVYPYLGGANRIGIAQDVATKLLSNTADKRISATFRPLYLKSGSTTSFAGTLLIKFVGREDAGTQLYDNDYPIYRYAEVLLLLAEAKTKLGLDPSAEINMIRQRAYGNGFALYMNASPDENMRAILEEELREFIGESKRWFALRRAGDKWVYQYINPQYLNQGVAYKLLLPVNIEMLNLDPKLVQNPGY